MKKINFEKKILICAIGRTEEEWQKNLADIKKLGIKEFSLFLEMSDKKLRQKIYQWLLEMNVKKIPLVHIRHDMDVSELKFLKSKFKTKYFTVHEINFQHDDILKWKGFYKNLELEMNFDDFVSKKVKVEKIGGFCVDLAHFKAGMDRLTKDFDYVYARKLAAKYFDCNHLNGYKYETNWDTHTISDISQFDYLKTLPDFVFGKIIALEMFNPIAQQLEFKKYLAELLEKRATVC